MFLKNLTKNNGHKGGYFIMRSNGKSFCNGLKTTGKEGIVMNRITMFALGLSLIITAACDVQETLPGATAGTGGTTATGGNTAVGGNSAASSSVAQICTPGVSYACTCTNGASGTQTCNSAGNGYSTCAQNPTSTGTGTATSTFDYTPKPSTQCGNGGWSAPNSSSWVGRPSADGKSFVVSTAWPFVGSTCISAPSTATIEAYDLTNDSGQIVDPCPAKSNLFGRVVTATSEGYVISMAGLPPGNVHFNLTYNHAYWYYINYAANDANFPYSSRLYVEKSQKASEPGSLGMVFHWDGNTVTAAPTFGGNYR
jgi:hypothetical protein